jgi:hypothetical protein
MREENWQIGIDIGEIFAKDRVREIRKGLSGQWNVTSISLH